MGSPEIEIYQSQEPGQHLPLHSHDLLFWPLFAALPAQGPAGRHFSSSSRSLDAQAPVQSAVDQFQESALSALGARSDLSLERRQWLEQCLETAIHEGFRGGFTQSWYLPSLDSAQPSLLLGGLGFSFQLEGYRLQQAGSDALRTLKGQYQRLIVILPQHTRLSLYTRSLAFVSAVYNWQYTSAEALKTATHASALVLSDCSSAPLLSAGQLRQLQLVAAARSRARDLINTPPNLKHTRLLADRARELAGLGLKVQIEEDLNWIAANMPAFYSVARGSVESDPPRWIQLEYQPPTAEQVQMRIALIGKSVIFDTGGYQIKSDKGMLTMKADMAGGAGTLAVMEAVAKLQPKHLALRAYLAATPNLISSTAFVPDSIIESSCGKRIEIRHTDAEGRLTLIDAVSQACHHDPDLLLTMATLTGASRAAAGMRAALMSNEQPAEAQSGSWRERFADSARTACDPFQTLDVLAEDYEAIQSKQDAADIKNTGDGWGRGSQSAAAFVFSGLDSRRPIVHLDFAGGDMTRDDKATGVTVQGVLQFLLDLDQELAEGGSSSST
ncbi:MAG: hypothetical protein KDK39_13780 [Leptospiraceae bacterium]|nr:hypothetical protein [Leptospiraceae bacterium]